MKYVFRPNDIVHLFDGILKRKPSTPKKKRVRFGKNRVHRIHSRRWYRRHPERVAEKLYQH